MHAGMTADSRGEELLWFDSKNVTEIAVKPDWLTKNP